jgi:peptidyl-prolyl cis-trans isomerase A (cyclophilin A)
MHRIARLFVLLGSVAMAAGCSDKPATPTRTVPVGPAPDSFRVLFETTRGSFVVEVKRAWAPKGADRFYDLVAESFFDENRFFRVVPGFIAQFGASDDKKLNEQWDAKTIADDSVKESNAHGTLVFASDGKNSRSHQLFINLSDNKHLDKQGFAPIGHVVEGLGVVDSIYSGYGETPNYHLLATLGNSYLKRMFPKLDYIKTARIVGGSSVLTVKRE